MHPGAEPLSVCKLFHHNEAGVDALFRIMLILCEHRERDLYPLATILRYIYYIFSLAVLGKANNLQIRLCLAKLVT